MLRDVISAVTEFMATFRGVLLGFPMLRDVISAVAGVHG
jgi:hypothetical protein